MSTRLPDIDREIPYVVELQRKALHLVALAIPAGMALIGEGPSTYVLVPLALIMVGADALRWRSSGFFAWIDRYFGFMMRAAERVRGPSIVINGATWVMLTAALLALLFPGRIAIFTLIIFLVCDAAAAVFGRRFGRRRWPGSRRTLEGSAAFVATGFLIALAFPGIPFWVGALSVIAGAAAEVLRGPLNDNVRIAAATALTLLLLERMSLS